MIFDEARQAELKKYAFSVYILQALCFVLLFTPVVGLVINYLKDDEVRGSWLESHFRWQKSTFWYGMLWTLLGYISLPILIGYLVLPAVTVWLIYRIARGWICLVDGKEMYLQTNGEVNE
ncbi:MAG TPA: hypothetical protein VMZ32_15505 [Gammaproteobacteria bacterium]|nr:hypothetical protein [Gammaproteobacteria bacterium]